MNLLAKIMARTLLPYLDKRAEHYLRRRKNFNYDSKQNGEFELLIRLKKTDVRTVFDVGANQGLWTLESRELFPFAHTHSFEIIPSTFALLKKNTQNLDRITCNPFGLSDREGDAVAYTHPTASELATITSGGSEIHQVEFAKENVQVRTGDSYCSEHAIQKINFLKIDAEGAEGTILTGFSGMLEQQRIEVIQFEYGMANIYSRFLLKDFYSLLAPAGFAIGKLFSTGIRFSPYRPENEDFRGPNFVAVHQAKPELIRLLSET